MKDENTQAVETNAVQTTTTTTKRRSRLIEALFASAAVCTTLTVAATMGGPKLPPSLGE